MKSSRIMSFLYFARGMCLIAQTDRIAYLYCGIVAPPGCPPACLAWGATCKSP